MSEPPAAPPQSANTKPVHHHAAPASSAFFGADQEPIALLEGFAKLAVNVVNRLQRLEDKIIKFEIWDTAGQERFAPLAPMYYRNAQAAVVAYDITKAASLEKAKSWAYATEQGLLFTEASAKTGEFVMEVFTEIAKKIPLEHLLTSRSRGGSGAAGAAGSGNTVSAGGRVNLNEPAANAVAAGGCC
ncbi:hypothetical protein HDU83_008034 [Entophlyctis luteolus]|nr:hypothetical protein HDU83_008034 [Entophlyctis luteolus]